ncbi:hypothetical protein CVT25_008036 [Psilocybe cyanescens]|uniref:Uncharacterized protein n=1 Tax=Psilocybe cyanescens TaxID=93625 RepID=A0A409X9R0_PSICY|nr:hypothetical protein CVT25_008036 [Psilocybe cyanescens]
MPSTTHLSQPVSCSGYIRTMLSPSKRKRSNTDKTMCKHCKDKTEDVDDEGHKHKHQDKDEGEEVVEKREKGGREGKKAQEKRGKGIRYVSSNPHLSPS